MEDIKDKVTLLEELKSKVSLRDRMGGALYWNVLNDECCQLADKCVFAGCDRNDIRKILGEGTFCF